MSDGCCVDLAAGSDALWHNIAVLTTKITPYRCLYKAYLHSKTGLDCLFIVVKIQEQCSARKSVCNYIYCYIVNRMS